MNNLYIIIAYVLSFFKHVILVKRFKEQSVQTKSTTKILYKGKVVFQCNSLELPWRENQNEISCIPVGIYDAILHQSPTYGQTIKVLNVTQRSNILFHWGNFYKNTKGCILLGKNFTDINGDGYNDVTHSKATVKIFLSHLKDAEKIKAIFTQTF